MSPRPRRSRCGWSASSRSGVSSVREGDGRDPGSRGPGADRRRGPSRDRPFRDRRPRRALLRPGRPRRWRPRVEGTSPVPQGDRALARRQLRVGSVDALTPNPAACNGSCAGRSAPSHVTSGPVIFQRLMRHFTVRGRSDSSSRNSSARAPSDRARASDPRFRGDPPASRRPRSASVQCEDAR